MNLCTSLAKVHLRVSAQIGKRKKENSKNFTWQKYLAQGIESLHTTLTKGGCGRSHFGKSWKIYLTLKNKYFNLPARLILSLPKFIVRKFYRETNYFNYEIKTCNKMMNWRISHDNKSQATKLTIISYQASGKASIPYWVCSSYFLCYKGTINMKIRSTLCCWKNHITQ